MARSGQASVEVLADFARFAAMFQKDLNAALRGVKIDMTGVSNQISNGVRDGVNAANQEFKRLGNQADESFNLITQKSASAGRSMAASFASAGREMSSIGDQMSVAISLPVAAAGVATIGAAGNFEKAMNRVKALSGATADEFGRLRQQAIDLGSTTQYSASQAADAMGYLSMAGFTATQTLDALPGVLSLAAAGAIDLADAADIASNILSGYGYQAKDLEKINDILAKTFTSTNTTLMSLGETFKYVGPVASSAGVMFEELSAAIGLMGNAGIQGSEAGTALRGAIARLLKPTNEVTNTLEALGVSVVDSSGKLLPLVDIVRQLEVAGADTADMMTIFGLEAGPAMQALVSQGSSSLADLTMKLRTAGGTADRIAKTQMEGFNGSLDELKSSSEGLMIAIGDAGLLGWMTSLTDSLTELTMRASRLSPTFLRVTTIVAIVAAAIGPFLAVFGRMATAIGEGILAFKKIGAWALRVAPWLTALAGPVGWVIAALLALAVAAVVAYKKIEAFRTVVDRAFRAVAAASLWMWQTAIVPAFNWIVAKAQVVGAAIVRLWQQAQPVFVALGATVMKIWNSAIKPAIGSIGTSFATAGSAIVEFWTGSAQPALSSLMGLLTRLGVAVQSWWTGNGDAVMRTAASVMTWLGGVSFKVWTAVMTVLKAVAAVISWVVVNVSVPMWTLLVSVIKTVVSAVMSMKSVWTIVGAIIGAAIAVVVVAVKALWAVITTEFTAISAVVTWLWRTIIVPAFTVIGAVIKEFVAVVSWMWSSVVSPVFQAIAAIINMVGSVILWLWSSVVSPVFRAIGAVVSWVLNTIIMPVFNGIVAAVGVVVSAVTWLWNTFGPVFSAIGNLVWTVWSGVISVVFSLFKLALSVVGAVVQVFWGIIKAVFLGVASIIMMVWSSAISPILSGVGALFTWLWGVIQPIISGVGALFTWLWGVIQPVVSSVADGISWLWGIVQTVFNAVVAFIQGAIVKIVAAAGGVAGFVNSISNHFQGAVNAIQNKIGLAVSFVRGLPGKILGALGNLGSLLYDAGARIIQGLINGISSMIGSLRGKMSSVASTVRGALPFSPAKYGPLSGAGSPDKSGEKISMMIAEGLTMRIPEIRTAVTDVAAVVARSVPMTVAAGEALSVRSLEAPVLTTVGGQVGQQIGPAVRQNTYNLTINALDPKSAASAVIEAIAAWERSNGSGWRR